VAAVLLQNDLWTRFDELDFWLRRTDPPVRLRSEERRALADLRTRLGRMIRRLALPEPVLRSIPPNPPEAARAHPDLLADLDSERGWQEVGLEGDGPHEPRRGTRHGQVSGYTSVFRVLARVPSAAGGSAWLRRALASHPVQLALPAGTRTVILQTPMAISQRGQLFAVPLVTLIETMRSLGPGAALPAKGAVRGVGAATAGPDGPGSCAPSARLSWRDVRGRRP
jgi:hypothetical protein